MKHKCVHCGKGFSHFSNMNRHVRLIHEKLVISAKYVNCPKCQKLVQATSLKKHMMAIHEKTRDHICDYCDKGFSQSYTLKVRNLNFSNYTLVSTSTFMLLNKFRLRLKIFDYSHLFNKRGDWNKRGGGAKVAKSLNVEVGINVEGEIFWKKLVHNSNKQGVEGGKI